MTKGPVRRGVALTLTCLIAAASGRSQTSSDEELYRNLLRSTAWVVTDSGSGTAWVLDRARGLLITNFHVVLDTERYGLESSVVVVFPLFENGAPVAERAT